MYESFVDWYWSIFGVGENNVAFGSKIAALYSWLMLLAAGLTYLKYLKQQVPKFVCFAFAIVALSYSSTDLLMAGVNGFYRNFDEGDSFRAIAVSYTLLDSLTAILVMLVVQRMCKQANPFLDVVDIMVMILLYNGAAHFLVNGYYMVVEQGSVDWIAMLYSATIIITDGVLVLVMFFPALGGWLKNISLRSQLKSAS
ncbi:hypothetical protein [Pseudoalteromonas sp. MMG024]|uniref:hypothetical protein n=1 Tax=Pseudoalteromonas sp. MMG024 TaxID=2909980 RepID=UPI001F2F09AC|nr:hypothetical protein [Pseudoalteromonas sp. MMG024]MCF6458920.1 hypothetical protein [Pseudoalteromonas sp. MMG024]